ncbi:hypothetical protein N7470_002922 [Penicillium chermesinum]|nr:hypothetical protein N7470_002922 [Penicillium chermesinum]
MATAEGPARAHDRNGRRRPFSSWMKRLASLKSSSEPGSNRWSNRRGSTKGKKGVQGNNNPYPLSGTISRPSNPSESYAESERIGEETQSRSDPSLVYSAYENHTLRPARNPMLLPSPPMATPRFPTQRTMATAGGRLSSHGGGEGSTFSSPAPSVRSLTTTLTTVQSAAPSTQLYPNPNSQTTPAHGGSTQSSGNQQQVQFTHQFPTSSSPATAVPPHLIPHSHSVTYSTATANNVLTDNASVLTLASSSKRRRRNSLDTNASIRGLAPSSVFGGSRESLPLSVLSGNVADSAQGALNRPSVGLASAERISVYSASGVIPVTNNAGERGSFYTKQSQAAGDGASIRSGAPSHGRNDSTAASITGISSPLAMASGRISRRSSGWGEITGDEDEENKATEMADDKPNKAEASHEEIKTD